MEGAVVQWNNGIKRRGIAQVWKGYGTAICNEVFLQHDVVTVALSHTHGLLLTVERKVYSFEFETNGLRPNVPSLISALTDLQVVDVACGPGRSAAVCEDGRLFMWGENSLGQCGFLPSDTIFVDTPKQVLLREHVHMCAVRRVRVWRIVRIVQVACGEAHTLALSNTGEVWGWGAGLSIEHPLNLECVGPSKITAFQGRRATAIACGDHHNLVVVLVQNNDIGDPNLKFLKPSSSGCSICDEIFALGFGDDLEEDSDCCPLGIPLEVEPNVSTFALRHSKDKRTKEMENAAYGSRTSVKSTVGSSSYASKGEVQKSKVQLLRSCSSDAQVPEVISLRMDNNSTSAQNEQSSEHRNETAADIVFDDNVTQCYNTFPAASNELSILSDNPTVGDVQSDEVSHYMSEEPFSPTVSSSASELFTRDICVPVSNVSRAEQMPHEVTDQNVTSEVDRSLNLTDSSFDEFSFVSKYGWAANEARFESSLQDLELMSCNSKDAEMASGLSDSCHFFDDATNSGASLLPELNAGNKPSKVSSCEIMNRLHDFTVDSVNLLLHGKDDLQKVNQELSCQTEVWSWGKGIQGQLGHGDALDRSSPVCVKTLNHIGVVKVAAGAGHSMALTANGEVYVWGSNSHGQLASDDNKSPSYSPCLLPVSDKAFVWDIAASSKSSLLLVNQGGEQEILFCGKQEGPLEKAASTKSATLLSQTLLVKNCKIREIFAGGPYCGCVLDQVTGGHLCTLYELAITELHFFCFVDRLNKLALQPILKSGELLNSPSNESTIMHLFDSFNDIAKNSARNGHRLRFFIQSPTEQSTLPLFHDVEQQLEVYRTYCSYFCDALAINSFGVCLKVAHDIFKKSSKDLWNLCSEEAKGIISAETLQHLMEEPIRRMTQYKKLFSNLAEQHKLRDWPSHWELLVAEKWGKLITRVSIQKQESERTRAFWDSCPRKVADALKMPLRRFLRDTKSSPVYLMNSSKFSSHWFIVFNDILVHSQFSGLTIYDLALVWVDPAPDLQLGNGNIFSVTVPEDTLTLCCESTHAKVEWVCCLNDAINGRVKLAQRQQVSRRGIRRNHLVRRTPPLSRHSSFTFTKNLLYKDATYTGMWFCGQMQGQGELMWLDGRKYVGRFRQNKQDGFGTYIVDSTNGQTVYEGIWKNGKLHGIGNIRYPNGDTYEGYFKNGLRHGHGVLKSGRFIQSHSSIYVGQWLNDRKQGYGIMDNIEKGEKYMGMWHEDVRHGKAVLVTLDGIYFEGSYVRGQMGGIGLIFDNNSWYEGEVGPEGTFNGKGLLTLASGDIIHGQFTGSWSDGIKISGLFTKAIQRKPTLEKTYPKSFGTLCVLASEKWNDIFHHCCEQLGVEDSIVDTQKAWESMAVVITNWKKHMKPSRSRQFQLASADLNILERIPPKEEGCFSLEKYAHVKTYLHKAFDTPYHPLGKLMDGLVDVYRATYIGIGAHPCLLWHAVEEVRSLIGRINDIVRILFPVLPQNGSELILNVVDQSDEETLREMVITAEGLLLPIFLPKIYPPLFTLYALHYEKDDNVYWETLLKWNKQPDISLMAFLDVNEKFWRTNEDANMAGNKRQSMSAARDVHYMKAIDTLQQLSTTFSPHDKLLIVQKVFEEINIEVQNVVSNDYVWTMDDLFPVFQYVVVRACIKHLGSEIHMVDDLMEKRLQNGELGIMFTMLKACYFQVANERCLVV